MNQIILYGSPLSLFTGRARSYLIKAGLSYHETVHAGASPHYMKNVLPKAGGRMGIPTVETETGEVIRDGAAIIDHFEKLSDYQFSPKTPKQKILSLLFDVIGAEGLLRPAMHYRWNFPEENHAFLHFHFATMQKAGPTKDDDTERSMQAMRKACMAFGNGPETRELVEQLYLELLDKLDAHFANQPYLLGCKPSIGDFGLIAPFYGHLGRDPKPLSLMQARAIRMFRWVERMNRPDLDVGEFEVQNGEFLPDDAVPDTLIDLVKHIAIDFVPETRAAAACINQWLGDQTELVPGTQVLRGVGLGAFKVRDTTINALAQPYRFYLLKRLQDTFDTLTADEQADVKSMLADCNMQDVLDIKISRDIGRNENLEVWL